MESKQLLKRYFGYDEFLSGQKELINNILSGKNVLGIMPTGGGKSICYQLPSLVFEGLTIVISPLISLMKDQVNLLRANGIDSAYINSSLSSSEYYSVISGINTGKYKIIYIAPERFESDTFLEIIHEKKVSMVAVDEAHCVSQWGHDFRPSYLKIRDFIDKIGDPVVAAFTATATENVKKDIIKLIGLKKHELVSTGYDRKNLYFEVRKSKNKFQELVEILELEEGNSGIIYCNTRKSVKSVCSKLIKLGYSATRYHAGLGDNERNNNQEMFILDKKLIMVATNAFGMGIDKSNVNFVIHYNMPKNLENYYQEAGRAGRDGSPAKCILLYSYQDVVINKFLIEKTIESENYKDSKLKEKLISKNIDLLNKIQEYCTTRECYRRYILDYFEDSTHSYTGSFCGNCYNCSGDFELIDVSNESFQIISAVDYLKNNNKRFGKRMIIDILKGSNTKKIKNLSFNTIPPFSKLNNKSKDEIGLIIDFLVDKKYLRISGDKYPVIKLWKNYEDILNGLIKLKMKFSNDEITNFKENYEDKIESKVNEDINVYEDNIIKNKPECDLKNQNNNKNKLNTKLIGSKSHKTPSINQITNDLFEKLRKIRLSIAHEKDIPPFMIFHDSSLKDMCKKLPTSESEFLEVSGVGKVKMARYGEVFINTIINNTNNADSIIKNNLVDYNKPTKKSDKYIKINKTIESNKTTKINKSNKINKFSKSNKNNKSIRFDKSTKSSESTKFNKYKKSSKSNKNTKSAKYNNNYNYNQDNNHDDLNIDIDLFKKLKEIRLKISKDQGVPAYIIFHDSSLKDMCKKLPTSESEFLEVSGVGKVKMKKYGNLFIEAVKGYKSSSYSSKSQNKRKFNLKLFNKLKKLRLDIASDEGIPPFIIFSDNTLRELSLMIPVSESEFLKISGVTQVKMKKYGKYFLNVIKKYNGF
ncbi:MAG: RecQ family ATP-dependent DNA helicase [Methanobrevibacter sp.]|nr:RecQ family ATP-dependent DNA helicase [Methanobrevibacter sp.]MEA4956755.1 RecQ family ATP-dependent DNA helicase [Methanobrevibacter sp.]